ncbi:MAG: hypothetical protein ABIS01_02835 [Ferruginibacter sp.]
MIYLKTGRALFTNCLLFFSICAKTQEVKYFEVINDIPVVKSEITGTQFSNSFFIVPTLSHFVLIGAHSDSVIIRFINWSSKVKHINKFRDSVLFLTKNGVVKGNEYYLMKKSDLDSNCVRMYARGLNTLNFTVGFVTMPLKLRLGKDFEFESTISLGATAGMKMRISRHYRNYFNLLFGASTSTVTLDSFSTNGKATQPQKNILVFSPSFGIVLEFDKSQIGLFYGWDLLGKSNNAQYGWIYNRKPWITLGFGISIFSLEDKKPKKE